MLIVCGREDLGEEYMAELIYAVDRERILGVDPVVKILRVLKYPRQHALYWPDQAIEIPPIAESEYVRMHVLRAAGPDELKALGSWDECLRHAQERALQEETNEEAREIIRRHLSGEYRRKRTAHTFTRWEIDELVRDRYGINRQKYLWSGRGQDTAPVGEHREGEGPA